MRRRYGALMGLLFILSAFTIYCGNMYLYNDWTSVNGPTGKILFLLETLSYMVMFLLIILVTDRLPNVNKAAEELGKQNIAKSAHQQIIGRIAILSVVYLFYWLAYYPGVYGWDTANQLRDFFTGMKPYPYGWARGQTEIATWLNDHHPVMDTLVFSLFYWLGTLTGHVNWGLGLYCIIQIILTAGVFVHGLEVMRKNGAPYWFQCAGMLFFCMPFIAFYTITMIKDSLYAIMFFEYLVEYFQLMQGSINRKRLARLTLLSLLCALTKKTGVYICCASNLCLLLKKDVRKQLLAGLMTFVLPAFIIFIAMNRMLFPLLSVYPGGKQEALGMLFQQTARTVTTHRDGLEEKQIADIDGVLDSESLEELYDPRTTDSVKDHFKFGSTNEDLKNYLESWFKVGLRYPGTYLNATFAVNGGYFAPVRKMTVYTLLVELPDIWPTFRQPHRLAPLRDAMQKLLDWLQGLPGIDLFFTLVLYVWWIPLWAVYRVIIRKDFRALSSLIPIGLSVCVLLISPLCQLRYAVSQVYAIPLVLGCGLGYWHSV